MDQNLLGTLSITCTSITLSLFKSCCFYYTVYPQEYVKASIGIEIRIYHFHEMHWDAFDMFL